jgi:hypothetical protein
LVRPGYWLDQVAPPFSQHPGAEVLQLAEAQPENGTLRVQISGPDFDDADDMNNTSIILELGAAGDGETRLSNAGLMILEEDGKVIVDGVTWDSNHKQLDQLFTLGDYDNPVFIDTVMLKTERIVKEVFYIPALLLLALIGWLQLGRARKTPEVATA